MLYLFIPDWPEYAAGYDGNIYRIESRHKSPRVPRPLKGWKGSSGYLQVYLSRRPQIKQAVLVHRIIAQLFVPNPNNHLQVDHVDEIKTNNAANNLQWVSASHNVKKSGKKISGALSGKPKNKAKDIAPLIHKLKNKGLTFKEISVRLRYSVRYLMSVVQQYPQPEVK